jgi:hypothetical protein
MSQHHSTEDRATSLAESRRSRLERAVERHGKGRVLATAGIVEGTLWRALARGPLYRSTAVAIDAALDMLERT